MTTPTTIEPNNSGTIELGVADPADQPVSVQVVDFAVLSTANTSQRPGTYGAPPQTRNLASSHGIRLRYLQDWGATPVSLSEFLRDNDGKLIWFKFTPDDTAVPTSEGQCYGMAGAYGGDAGSTWDAEVTMPVLGAPNNVAQTP